MGCTGTQRRSQACTGAIEGTKLLLHCRNLQNDAPALKQTWTRCRGVLTHCQMGFIEQGTIQWACHAGFLSLPGLQAKFLHMTGKQANNSGCKSCRCREAG